LLSNNNIPVCSIHVWGFITACVIIALLLCRTLPHRSISEMVLLSVEKKVIYQHSQFQELQTEHHTHAKEKLVAAVEEISEIMANIYKVRPCKHLQGGTMATSTR